MERLIPGWISFSSANEPIEVTKIVNKEFVKGIYIFMLDRGKILNLEGYFNDKSRYVKQGRMFDEDLTEIFVENHRYG